MTTTIGVLINSISNDDHEWYSVHRIARSIDENLVALDRAIKKHFGKTAFFQINHELTTNACLYGQVFKPLKNDCVSTSVTSVVTVQFN